MKKTTPAPFKKAIVNLYREFLKIDLDLVTNEELELLVKLVKHPAVTDYKSRKKKEVLS